MITSPGTIRPRKIDRSARVAPAITQYPATWYTGPSHRTISSSTASIGVLPPVRLGRFTPLPPGESTGGDIFPDGGSHAPEGVEREARTTVRPHRRQGQGPRDGHGSGKGDRHPHREQGA